MKELVERFIELSEEYLKHVDLLRIGWWQEVSENVSIYVSEREHHSVKSHCVEYDKNMTTINIPYSDMELSLTKGTKALEEGLEGFINKQKTERQNRLDKEIQLTQEKLNNLLKIKNNESVQSI